MFKCPIRIIWDIWRNTLLSLFENILWRFSVFLPNRIFNRFMQQRHGKKYESEKGFNGIIACSSLNGGSLEIMSVVYPFNMDLTSWFIFKYIEANEIKRPF